MKRNLFFVIFYALTLVVTIINAAFLIKNNIFIDINNVPQGKYEYNVFSPDGETELRVYSVDLGLADSVRVSYTKNKVTKNIFWQTQQDNVKIIWLDNNRVKINDIQIDLVKNEYYDSRSIRSIFNDGLMGW